MRVLSVGPRLLEKRTRANNKPGRAGILRSLAAWSSQSRRYATSDLARPAASGHCLAFVCRSPASPAAPISLSSMG